MRDVGKTKGKSRISRKVWFMIGCSDGTDFDWLKILGEIRLMYGRMDLIGVLVGCVEYHNPHVPISKSFKSFV